MKCKKVFKKTIYGRRNFDYEKMSDGFYEYLNRKGTCQTSDGKFKCNGCPFVNGNWCALRVLASDFKKDKKE